MKEAITVIFVAVACYTDWKSKKIKNELLLAMMLYGFCAGFFFQQINGVVSSFFGLLLCSVLPFPLYLLRMFGAGDIKLLGCVAAIVGWRLGVMVMLYSFLAGGLLAGMVLLYQKNAKQRWKTLKQYLALAMMTQTLPEYEDVRQHRSVFRFSYAVFLGVCTALILQ